MHKILSNIILLIFISFMISDSYSNEIELNSFDNAIKNYQAKNLLVGNILVSTKNRTLFHKRIELNNEHVIQIGPNTSFPIASITKQFTAVAILLLYKDQKLDLHTPIISYLPAHHYIWHGKVPHWAFEVTIHHLLTHSSGIKNYTDIPYKTLHTLPKREALKFVIDSIKDEQLKFKPGEKFDYNNTGYFLLSLIVEELSKEHDFSLFLANHLFRPLGMKNTYLPDVSTELSMIQSLNINPIFPKRYIADLENLKSKPKLIDDVIIHAPLMGTGALISTENDLLKWNQALYSGKIIANEYLKLMLSPHIEAKSVFMLENVKYGYGIVIHDSNPNNIIYGASGWINGIRTELNYSVKNGISVVILSNLAPDSQLSEEILSRQIRSLMKLSIELQNVNP